MIINQFKYCPILVFIHSILSWAGQPCVPRDFGHSSFVCVCNSTYCDTYDQIGYDDLSDTHILHFESDRPEGKRFQRTLVEWDNSSNTVGAVARVNKNTKFQSIIGFGGAFTDAAGINIAKLSPAAQDNLIRSYYSPEGSEYNLGRTHIGGCDFSDRPYTYCDQEGDVDLVSFALAQDDLEFKIPFIKKAIEVSEKDILMYASPWSAPGWMKSNGVLNGEGYLLPEYYQAWANYFIKFLDAYREKGVNFWGLTAQNEPLDGNIAEFTFNCMGWNASTQTTWIVNNLGPTLEDQGYGDLKLMAFDDQRPLLPTWADELMANPLIDKYVSGWAVHWYVDFLGAPGVLDIVNEAYPDKFILYSEACAGSYPWETTKVILGSWERGEEYMKDIIENLNHWSTGWTDWNLALDMRGGPNWANNFVDSPIIVNDELDEFYKNPMYYALSHFSKFLPEGSSRIGLDIEGYDADMIQMTAFERPDGAIAIIAQNQHAHEIVTLRFWDESKALASSKIHIGPQSMNTFIWI